MKLLFLLLLLPLFFSGCVFDSVGVGGSYTDETGRSYGGNVNLHIRDDSKQVRRPTYAK